MADPYSDQTTTVYTAFDSTLDSVDRAEDLALEAAAGFGLSEDDVQRIGMAVREAMVNAVVHGNGYSHDRTVHFFLSQTPAALRVVIRDEGEGFDFDSIPDPTADENLLQQSGRGFLLMRTFVDECHIRHGTPRGTEVELVKYRSGGGTL
ncbi:MAG: ATP-binding protein [Bryobacterales bacterium]|nr:ATP-binding protein [Bryobacterales bacterium]